MAIYPIHSLKTKNIYRFYYVGLVGLSSFMICNYINLSIVELFCKSSRAGNLMHGVELQFYFSDEIIKSSGCALFTNASRTISNVILPFYLNITLIGLTA